MTLREALEKCVVVLASAAVIVEQDVVLVVAGLGIFGLAACVQALTGFGASLVAMPLLVQLTDPVSAVFACTLAGALISGTASRTERRHASRELATRLTCWALVGVPVGLVGVALLSDRTLRLVLVGTVAVAILVELRGTRLRPGGRLTDLCGFGAGALLVTTGINGPPLVLALRGLEPRRYRATLQVTFLLQDVAALAALAIAGHASATGLWLALAGIGGIPLGWRLGDHLFGRVTPGRLRLLILAGLVASASAVLVSGL